MKELSFERMEEVSGGSDCGWAIASMGLATAGIIGTLLFPPAGIAGMILFDAAFAGTAVAGYGLRACQG